MPGKCFKKAQSQICVELQATSFLKKFCHEQILEFLWNGNLSMSLQSPRALQEISKPISIVPIYTPLSIKQLLSNSLGIWTDIPSGPVKFVNIKLLKIVVSNAVMIMMKPQAGWRSLDATTDLSIYQNCCWNYPGMLITTNSVIYINSSFKVIGASEILMFQVIFSLLK